MRRRGSTASKFSTPARRRRTARFVANGGRVLNVSAMAKTVSEAQAQAYKAVDKIQWPDGFCRRDIGWQAVKREKGG